MRWTVAIGRQGSSIQQLVFFQYPLISGEPFQDISIGAQPSFPDPRGRCLVQAVKFALATAGTGRPQLVAFDLALRAVLARKRHEILTGLSAGACNRRCDSYWLTPRLFILGGHQRLTLLLHQCCYLLPSVVQHFADVSQYVDSLDPSSTSTLLTPSFR